MTFFLISSKLYKKLFLATAINNKHILMLVFTLSSTIVPHTATSPSKHVILFGFLSITMVN